MTLVSLNARYLCLTTRQPCACRGNSAPEPERIDALASRPISKQADPGPQRHSLASSVRELEADDSADNQDEERDPQQRRGFYSCEHGVGHGQNGADTHPHRVCSARRMV